jgi:hypothetical protein
MGYPSRWCVTLLIVVVLHWACRHFLVNCIADPLVSSLDGAYFRRQYFIITVQSNFLTPALAPTVEKVVEQPRATIQEEIQPPEAPPGPVETNNEIADIMATNTYGLIESKSRVCRIKRV